MATDNAAVEQQRPEGPKVVRPTSWVNVALPFSNISVREPGPELHELVAVVAELVGIIEELSPGARVEALRARVNSLAESAD